MKELKKNWIGCLQIFINYTWQLLTTSYQFEPAPPISEIPEMYSFMVKNKNAENNILDMKN